MKTKDELNALKEEVEAVSRKLHELTDEELAHVTGGNPDFDVNDISTLRICDICGQPIFPGIRYGQHLYSDHETVRLQITPRGLK